MQKAPKNATRRDQNLNRETEWQWWKLSSALLELQYSCASFVTFTSSPSHHIQWIGLYHRSLFKISKQITKITNTYLDIFMSQIMVKNPYQNSVFLKGWIFKFLWISLLQLSNILSSSLLTPDMGQVDVTAWCATMMGHNGNSSLYYSFENPRLHI